jgi:hypothetical protein
LATLPNHLAMNHPESSIERSNEMAMRVAKGFVMMVMIVLALMVALLVMV